MNKLLLAFVLVLLVALATSLALNVSLYQEANDNYRELNGVRLDPLGLSVYQEDKPPSVTESGYPLVVFFGDSRAAEWPNPPAIANATFVNRGVGAQSAGPLAQNIRHHIARPIVRLPLPRQAAHAVKMVAQCHDGRLFVHNSLLLLDLP
jgi:hypothetical protein